ncbi:MAG: hypothetical protein ACRECT_04690 [Thermoplasmata archaeon]
MRSPLGWFLPAVALLAAGVAVWAGPNFALAIPAAATATLAAALLFLDAWFDRPGRVPARLSAMPPRETSRLRAALTSGTLGREELVLTLDTVERKGLTPDLPVRTVSELEAIVGLPAKEFRDYLRERVERLEAGV